MKTLLLFKKMSSVHFKLLCLIGITGTAIIFMFCFGWMIKLVIFLEFVSSILSIVYTNLFSVKKDLYSMVLVASRFHFAEAAHKYIINILLGVSLEVLPILLLGLAIAAIFGAAIFFSIFFKPAIIVRAFFAAVAVTAIAAAASPTRTLLAVAAVAVRRVVAAASTGWP